VLKVFYHRAKFGEAQISHATTEFFVWFFVRVSVTLLKAEFLRVILP